MMAVLAALALAYLIGSIPTAFIFGKVLKGIDIRTVGSGNIGATNVYRAVGKVPGIAVLMVDILKGAAPVAIIPMIVPVGGSVLAPDIYKILIGAAAIAGHVWTVFMNFKGGKGVATTAGVVLILAPDVVGIVLVLWIAVMVVSRYVSVASIAAAITLPVTAYVLGKQPSIIIFLSIISVIGIYKHKGNIIRLRQGSEHKIY